jgi:small subunit ribosomal protein S15
LKFWPHYPQLVQRWITNTKTPRGHFDNGGMFFPSGKFDSSDQATVPVVRPVPPIASDFVVDSDLAGHYRFGIQPHEIASMHPKLKRLFSLESASKPEVRSFRNIQAVKQWGSFAYDSGKTEVQIVCMTTRIKAISEHLATNRKDHSGAMGLKRLIGRRRRLLQYLKAQSVARYYAVISHLELRDF